MRLALALLALLALPRASFAQPTGDPQRTATAQALFTQGAELLRKGDVAGACPKLEEALRLEPAAVGGRLKLAECYERAGRLASAWGAFSVAEAGARGAGQAEREKTARERAAELKPRLSTLTLRAPPGSPGVVLERDGLAVGEGQLGTAVPVDGGAHRCVAYFGGKAYWERQVDVKTEGEAVVVVAPAPPVEPQPAVVAPRPPFPPPPPSPPRLPPPAQPPSGGEAPAWAWAVGGAGLGALAVGVGLRLDAAEVESKQAGACGPALDQCPPSFDVAGTNRHKEDSFTAFVALQVVGGLAVTAGVIGVIVGVASPSRGGARARLPVLPRVAALPGGVLLGGTSEW